MADFIPFAPPLIESEDENAVLSALRSGWLSTGPKTKEFEERFAKYIGVPHALALNSCTAGLHIALRSLEVGPGDEVVTTPMTFCASANVIEHVRGTTVLADIDPETLLIDPEKVQSSITSKTKVIMPVHYAGHPADLPALVEIAATKRLQIVEDAAHCMPSKIDGQWVGSFGNFTAFSFYANKNMTTGEGGMLTGPEELMDRARRLSLHGMSRDAWKRFQKGGSWKYDVEEPGYKYNMTDLQASLGLVQLAKLERMHQRRKEIARMYEEAFRNSDLIQLVRTQLGMQHSHHLFVIRLRLEALNITRDQFIEELKAEEIATSVHYIPIHMHSYYQKKYKWNERSFPEATRAFYRMLSLPLSPAHSNEAIERVIDVVLTLLRKHKR